MLAAEQILKQMWLQRRCRKTTRTDQCVDAHAARYRISPGSFTVLIVPLQILTELKLMEVSLIGVHQWLFTKLPLKMLKRLQNIA